MSDVSFACLSSPLFERIRVPGRATMTRIANRVCQENGIDATSVRARRARYSSDNVSDARREIIREARAAGFPFSAIGDWFGHRDGTTVTQWAHDLGIE